MCTLPLWYRLDAVSTENVGIEEDVALFDSRSLRIYNSRSDFRWFVDDQGMNIAEFLDG